MQEKDRGDISNSPSMPFLVKNTLKHVDGVQLTPDKYDDRQFQRTSMKPKERADEFGTLMSNNDMLFHKTMSRLEATETHNSHLKSQINFVNKALSNLSNKLCTAGESHNEVSSSTQTLKSPYNGQIINGKPVFLKNPDLKP